MLFSVLLRNVSQMHTKIDTHAVGIGIFLLYFCKSVSVLNTEKKMLL